MEDHGQKRPQQPETGNHHSTEVQAVRLLVGCQMAQVQYLIVPLHQNSCWECQSMKGNLLFNYKIYHWQSITCFKNILYKHFTRKLSSFLNLKKIYQKSSKILQVVTKFYQKFYKLVKRSLFQIYPYVNEPKMLLSQKHYVRVDKMKK